MTLWLLARSTGMVAFVAFTVSVVLGALASDTDRPVGAHRDRVLDRRLLRQLAHRSAGVVGLGALAAHVVLILLDSFVSVSLLGALVPFTAGYRPVALALGTFAVYLFALVAASGAARGRLAESPVAARRWRVVHRLAYVGWALAMAHGVLAGTDTGALWSSAVYAVCALSVGAALWVRMGRSDRRREEPLTRARLLTRIGGRP